MNVVIYHAPRYVFPSGWVGKVGCTDNLERRKSQYEKELGKPISIVVLERLNDVTPKQAGDREWYWAKKLKCPFGRHYKVSIKGAPISGKRGTAGFQTMSHKQRSNNGKVTAFRNSKIPDAYDKWAAAGRTNGACKAGGRVAGRIAVTSGQLKSIASMGGKIAGRIAVESGQLAKARAISFASPNHVSKRKKS